MTDVLLHKLVAIPFWQALRHEPLAGIDAHLRALNVVVIDHRDRLAVPPLPGHVVVCAVVGDLEELVLRRKRPESLDAYDLFLRAVPYTASQTAVDGQAAIRYLEEALRIEPDYPAAHALAAWCYEWCYSRSGFEAAHKEAALRHARAALVGGTDDATAVAIAGFVTTMLSQDHEAGVSAIERALALNPSCATALYLGAITNAFAGHPAAAMAQASRALRLSPFDLLVYLAYLAQGVAAVQDGGYEEAGIYMERMLQANPSLSSLYFIGAAALALGGRLEAGRTWADQGLVMEPGFRCRLFRELIVHQVADRLAEGGRLLDLPA